MSGSGTGFKLGLSGCSGALEAMSTSRLLALAPLVESLGFEALWLNEEHFQGGQEFGRLCLSPIPLASAMLARTSRLRVGFSVLLLSLHHPIRLAEELATLDVLSEGRVDFGVSRGSQPRYAEAFGVSGAGAPLADALAPVLEAWSERELTVAGAAVSVQPKPVQKPHPPIYIATYTPDTAAWAGRAGYRMICHGITDPAVNDSLMSAFADGGGDRAAVPFGRFVYVGDSDEQARKEVWPTILALTARLQRIGIHKRGGSRIIDEALLEPERFVREMVVVGSPASCAEQILALSARYGTRYFNGLAGFFGFLPFDLVLRSLTLLGDEVRPLLNR